MLAQGRCLGQPSGRTKGKGLEKPWSWPAWHGKTSSGLLRETGKPWVLSSYQVPAGTFNCLKLGILGNVVFNDVLPIRDSRNDGPEEIAGLGVVVGV